MLVDTSTLLRFLQPLHPQRETARSAIKALGALGHDLHIVPQNLFELWVVATRPVAQNGLGLSIPDAASELKSMFPLLPDTIWEAKHHGPDYSRETPVTETGRCRLGAGHVTVLSSRTNTPAERPA